MRAVALLLVALCLVPDQILSGKIAKYGMSSWCRRGKLDVVYYPVAPNSCCNVLYGCDVFIKPGKTKWEITNTGEWNLRRCACDVLFYECLLNKQSPTDAFKTLFLVQRHSCLAPKKCESETECAEKYQVVNYGQLISEMNKMYEAEEKEEEVVESV